MATSAVQCRFCEHYNPSDASFCNRCGAQLNFAPCAHCGAVNESSAAACFQCGQPFGSSAAGAPLHEPRAAASLSTVTDHRLELIDEIAGSNGVALTAIAVSPAPRNRARHTPLMLVAGAIALGALVFGMYAGRREPVAPTPTVASNPEAVSGTRSITGVDQPLPAATPVRPRPIARSGDAAPAGGATSAGGMATIQSCTAGVAALGLCTEARGGKPSTVQARTPAESAPGANATTARSAGAAIPCSEARAALGLCVRTTTARNKK
jgi:hypothetical protein